jgi:hypothetical protein
LEIFVGECGMKPDVKRIVWSGRGKPARPISTQRHNVRLAIWLRGWHIEIYDVAKA